MKDAQTLGFNSFHSFPVINPYTHRLQLSSLLRHSCQLFPASAKSLQLYHVNETETVGEIQVLLFYIRKKEISVNNNLIYNTWLRKSDLNFICKLISPFPDGTSALLKDEHRWKHKKAMTNFWEFFTNTTHLMIWMLPTMSQITTKFTNLAAFIIRKRQDKWE